MTSTLERHYLSNIQAINGVSGVPHTYEYVLERFVVKGGPIPGYREKIAACQSATTFMSGKKFQFRPVSAFATWQSGPNVYYETGTLNSVSLTIANLLQENPSGSFDAEAMSRASQDFVEKYKKRSQHLQGLVALGEVGKTLHGLLNPARALRDALPRLINSYRGNIAKLTSHTRGVRHRNPGTNDRASTALRAFTDTWLEWQFGMVPTISDLEGAARALADLAEDPRKNAPHIRVNGAGGTEDTLKAGSSAVSWSGGYGTYGTFDWDVIQTTSARMSGGIKSTSSSYPTVASSVGLTLNDFLPSIWELIPFSWLSDYFANIGDVINVWSHQNIHLNWWQRTLQRQREVRVYNSVPDSPQTKLSTITGSSTVTDFTRSVPPLGEFIVVPDLSWTIPGLATKQALNMVAVGNSYRELIGDGRRRLRI